MLEELNIMSIFDILILIVALVLMVGFVLRAIITSKNSDNSYYLSEGHEPDPNCKSCGGTGILNEGTIQEFPCPCTDRTYY